MIVITPTVIKIDDNCQADSLNSNDRSEYEHEIEE